VAADRLEAKDLKILLVWILAGLAGIGIGYRYFFRAFPEAAIDFRVSRPAALEVARNFLTAQSHKLDGYQSSIVFSVDDFGIDPNDRTPPVKTYLEREVGLEEANRLMASEIKVWYWNIRFFRPWQKEEFRVQVSPNGRVLGMSHVIEESREGARLDESAARVIAETYLRQRSTVNPDAYEFLPAEANSAERPKRRDWSFTWERRGFRVPQPNGAPYRLRITLLGAQVGSSEEYLEVPETWKRDFQRLRSGNLFYQLLGEVPLYFLIGAIVFVIILQARRGAVAWLAALKLGGVVAVVFFAMEVNQWPLTRFGYDTNSSYEGFFVQRIALAALLSLGLGLVVALAFAAGEPLYRKSQPEQLRLRLALSIPGIHSKEFFRSCVIGLAMAAASVGYFVLFYVVGRKFGIWVPQEIKYTTVASTTFPWLAPLATSLLAATSEEFIFRLFAVHYLHKLTRSKVLAILIPAFIWGFGHSLYPVEPGYTRGIEVGIIGIVAGLVMLRYGILTTLIWHYTVDASLIGLFLLRSESLYFRISGAIVGLGVLIPLAVAGTSYLRRRRFEAEPSLLNRAEALAEPPEASAAAAAAEPTGAAYQALSTRTLGIALGCGALGVLLLVGVKAESIGDFVRFGVNARQAAARADRILRERKVEPARYRRTATVVNRFDPFVDEYLRRQVGIEGANRLYKQKVPAAFWRVRYYRDSEKEEFAIVLRADGALDSVHHALEEKAPGASLTKEEAQARAEAYLREEKKLDLSRWKLVEAKSDKRPARTDHTFTWEDQEAVGEAHVRAGVKVQGDEVSGYSVFVKIPEDWERRQKTSTLASIVYLIARIVFYVALGVVVLVLFFRNFKQPSAASIPWRRLIRWTLWGAAGFAIVIVNGLPATLAGYPTEMPFRIFVTVVVVFLFLTLAAISALLFLLFALAWFYAGRAFGIERLPTWRGMTPSYYRDAFVVALGGATALLGLARLPALLSRVWPTAQKSLAASVPSGLDFLVPAAQEIGGSIAYGLFVVGAIALTAGFVAGYLRRWWLKLGFVVLLALVQAGQWGSSADFAKRVLLELVILALAWWGVALVVRFNLLAYFLIAATVTLTGAATRLLQQPNPFFRANGYAVAGAALALMAWPLVAWLRAPAARDSLAGPAGPAG